MGRGRGSAPGFDLFATACHMRSDRAKRRVTVAPIGWAEAGVAGGEGLYEGEVGAAAARYMDRLVRIYIWTD